MLVHDAHSLALQYMIGALIDHSKGTGYNYPDLLPVEMGKSVLVDRKMQDATSVK